MSLCFVGQQVMAKLDPHDCLRLNASPLYGVIIAPKVRRGYIGDRQHTRSLQEKLRGSS